MDLDSTGARSAGEWSESQVPEHVYGRRVTHKHTRIRNLSSLCADLTCRELDRLSIDMLHMQYHVKYKVNCS